MGLFDFFFRSNKSKAKVAKSNTKSSPKKTYTPHKVTKNKRHDADGISISDEFEATVYERREYGIMVTRWRN